MFQSSKARFVIAVCCAIMAQGIGAQALWAAPVDGEQFRLPQPDGTWVDVRIWGDEFYGVTESLDGYTLVRDPVSLFLCYAGLTPDGNELYSTGAPAGTASPRTLGLSPHLRISQSAAQAKARAARDHWNAGWQRAPGGRGGPRSPTTGNVAGICLIVDFSDDVGTIPSATVDNYCNQVGFNDYGDNGSVRDYFFDVSDGALTYTNFVSATYYRAAHPKSYYTDPAIPYGQRAQELIVEALTDLENQDFDFSQYDADDDGIIDAVNCFYAGDIWNNWAEGLWPHSWWVDFCADGVCTGSYQITNMGASLYLRTFCHENGHMLMDWPDLYDYDYDSTGVGRFCLMAYSTSNTNPCEPCAYMKLIAGWSQTTDLTLPQPRLIVPASNANRFYKFNHPTLDNEYYLIENRQQTGRDAGLPDAGLAIWHIDTYGDNSNNEMTPESHYLVTLVQADGLWDLEHNRNYGDSTDLWAAPDYTQCTPTTTPDTDWWSGEASGLAITDISESATLMTFDYSASLLPQGIVAWGWNPDGQCNVPAPNTGFVAVAGGGSHSFGLKGDGSIVAWGQNGYGQCNVPAPNSGFVGLAAGYGHSLGLKADGSIVAWGRNDLGQCNIPAPNSGFVAVEGGFGHSLGLKADGSIVAWGYNVYGQCNVPAPNSGFVAVAAGWWHSLGLKADGSIVAWGWTNYGQCSVPMPNGGFVAVAAGNYHSLGLKADGSFVAWGRNDLGQCNVPAPNSGFVGVAGGGSYSLGLKADGSIVAWGSNASGQCNVPGPNTGFVAVAGGGAHSLGLRGYIRSDLNCDDAVNLDDIPHFVQALVDPAGYDADHDGAPYLLCNHMAADMTGDTIIDGRDIQGFVDALLHP